jgi:hypothetical protein
MGHLLLRGRRIAARQGGERRGSDAFARERQKCNAVVGERLGQATPKSTAQPHRDGHLATRLAGGGTTHVSTDARDTERRRATNKRRSGPSPADSLEESRLAVRSGHSPSRRRSPTTGIETASLQAKSRDLSSGFRHTRWPVMPVESGPETAGSSMPQRRCPSGCAITSLTRRGDRRLAPP